MQSLSFNPGRAFLSVNSPVVPWTVVFEDEGVRSLLSHALPMTARR